MPSIIKRVSADGLVSYEAAVRKRGFPPLSKTFPSRREAKAWSIAIESEIVRGTFVDRSVAERHTLADLLERYADQISPHKKGSAEEILRIRALKTDPIARYKITALSSQAMAEFRDRRLAGTPSRRAVSGSTVNRELTLLSHVLNTARREWGVYFDVNPVSQIRRPRENRARNRRLTANEEERLMAELTLTRRTADGRYSAGGTHNPWVRPATVLAIETAMRRSELLSMRWEDVFLEERFVRLRDTKNGDARDVPLSTRAVATLASLHRHPSGSVLPISSEALKLAFTRACERAGIAGLHFHDLRHEATSRLAERLDNVLELSAVTGHRTLQMLKRYYHPRARDLALKLG